MVRVDKGHEERPDRVVEEDEGGSHEHGETDEFVEHRRKISDRIETAGRGVGMYVVRIQDLVNRL